MSVLHLTIVMVLTAAQVNIWALSNFLVNGLF
jgi:hypothetical protein